MKIIVTGGAGFIGSHLVDRLLELGHYVISIDNYSTGRFQNLSVARGSDFFMDVNADIRNTKKIKRYFDGVDIVFNLMASKKTVCLKSPMDDCGINACGTLGLLQLAEEYGVKKFVHASTGSVYKEGATNENSPLEPVSYYGISKLAGESYVRLFSKKMKTVILRYFHVYGERQSDKDEGGVVSIFVNKAIKGDIATVFGTGNQLRQFTHWSDVVTLTTKLTFSDNVGIFNICNDEKISINDLIFLIGQRIKGLIMTQRERQEGDIDTFNVSNDKVKFITGHKFKKFEQGLNELITYYQNGKA